MTRGIRVLAVFTTVVTTLGLWQNFFFLLSAQFWVPRLWCTMWFALSSFLFVFNIMHLHRVLRGATTEYATEYATEHLTIHVTPEGALRPTQKDSP